MNNDLQRITRAKSAGSARPTLFWFLAIIDAFGIGASMAFLRDSAWLDRNEFALWFGVFTASFIGLIVLLWRMWMHDKFQVDVIERDLSINQEQQEPATVYHVQQMRENGRHIVFGKFQFTEMDWRKLAQTIFINNGRVTRDILAASGVIKNITSAWGNIYAEMERLAWVRDNQLTQTGIEWFGQFIPPTPPTNGAENAQTAGQRRQRRGTTA